MSKAYTTLIKQALILTFLLSTTLSCTGVMTFLTKDKGPGLIPTKKGPPTFCHPKKKLNLAHSSRSVISEFQNILSSLQKKTRLNFEEKAVLWTLYQVLIRPDSTNENSRFQFIIGNKKKWHYYDFNKLVKGQENLNLFNGLALFLKKNKRNKSLKKLIYLADRWFPKNVPVTRELSNFIIEHEKDLNLKVKKIFFKAGDALREGESLRRYSLKDHLKLSKRKTTLMTPPLFSFTPSGNTHPVQCSHDLNLYGLSIFLISPNREVYTNNFAYFDRQENFFMAVSQSHQYPGQKDSFKKRSYAFKGRQVQSQSPFCFMDFPEKKGQLFFFSMRDRDPGQHLYHLFEYQIAKVKNMSEVSEYIRFPRYEILNNPNRLLFENERATNEQLNALLELNFPLYHAQSLGEIWALGHLQKPAEYGLVTDERIPVEQTCQ